MSVYANDFSLLAQIPLVHCGPNLHSPISAELYIIIKKLNQDSIAIDSQQMCSETQIFATDLIYYKIKKMCVSQLI